MDFGWSTEALASGGRTQSSTQLTNLPRELGDFRIIRPLGRGGMGFVYEAEQLSLGRNVAIKVLPFAAMLSTSQLQRFKVEASACGIIAPSAYRQRVSLRPRTRCVLLRDAVDRRMQLGRSDFVAKQVGGGSRDHAADPNGDTKPSAHLSTLGPGRRDFYLDAARIGVQAAHALEHAHSKGVLHRDIKPSNLLIDNDGCCWVTDFGLASTGLESNITVSGDLLGTLRYMSPEQVSGTRHLDPRTDVYSLGATLFELLTGKPVVSGQNQVEIVQQLSRTKPVSPRTLDRAIPRDLEKVVLKSIATAPSDRYESAQHLADDLERFIQGIPVQASSAPWRTQLWQWSRRHPRLATGLAVFWGCLTMITAISVGVSQRKIAKTQTEIRRNHAATTLAPTRLGKTGIWIAYPICSGRIRTMNSQLPNVACLGTTCGIDSASWTSSLPSAFVLTSTSRSTWIHPAEC